MACLPDGIRESDGSRGVWNRHSSPISLIILGSLLVAGLSGILGGGPSPVQTRNFSGAQFETKMPKVLRNGQFFEWRFRIVAKAPLTNATLAISPSLWRDMTVNTMLPAAETEGCRDGQIFFDYGPIAAGEVVEIKLDGQINPPLFAGTSGGIALYDGKRHLGTTPVRIDVRP